MHIKNPIRERIILSKEDQIDNSIKSLEEYTVEIHKYSARCIENLWECIDGLKARITILEEAEARRIKRAKYRLVRRALAKAALPASN